MDTRLTSVLQGCTEASDRERVTFPEVVGRLMQAGVERYHTDLLRSEKIYYLPDSSSYLVGADPIDAAPAAVFSPDGVATAVRAIQTGRIRYKAFCRQIMDAGCVGYLVSIAGERAVYYGRSGETYVEPFPKAA